MVEIPEFYRRLLRSPGAATLSVLSKDGSIQSTLVWPDYENGFIKLNMLSGSPKELNIRRESKATLLASHPGNENLYISIRCSLHQITQEGSIAHLNMLTQRNMGLQSWYGDVEPENCETKSRRVVVYLEPIRVYHT